MARQRQVYAQAVAISEEFLGPAGERFMRRQIETHLSIDPEKLESKHISELIDWVRLAFTMLTSNAKYIEEFTSNLAMLADDRKYAERNALAGTKHGHVN